MIPLSLNASVAPPRRPASSRVAWHPCSVSFQTSADRAVESASNLLRGRFPDQVASVFWYGAVDIDTKHLVVWVILKGSAETLPKWFFPPTGEPPWGTVPDPMTQLPEDLRTLISEAVTMIREAFAQEKWPQASGVKVGFESDERVEAEGGWAYFK